MAKFVVQVTRISFGRREIEVEANSRDEAECLGMARASSQEFTSYTADYECDGVSELPACPA